jgi:hypothetical protein
MRDCVQQFLTAAAATLDLEGPVANVATDHSSSEARHWMRRQFAGKVALDCRVPATRFGDCELLIPSVLIERGSLRTLLCLDLVKRFDETAELLRYVLPLLEPGGLLLVTADIGDARPQEGLSRVLTPLGLERLTANLDGAIVGWQGDVDFPRSLFLVACRSPVPERFVHGAGRFIDSFRWQQLDPAPHPSWHMKLWSALRAWRTRGSQEAEETVQEETSFSLHLPSARDWKQALLRMPPAEQNPGAHLDAC